MMAAMKQHIENTRRQLGELGAMARQNEQAERKILARAEDLLAEVQAKIEKARKTVLAQGDTEAWQYQDLILERGRLQQVIAHSNQVLSGA